MKTSYRRSPIALAVLALLYEAPMHPYRMQQLIQERGKDEVINVRQRASLYQTIDRLLRAGLIQVRTTQREERFPERTIYELTEEGRTTVVVWMQEMLATPAQEFPEFPAALAHLPLLTPAEVQRLLERRAEALAAEVARIDGLLAGPARGLPRLFLLETEYLRAMQLGELDWVRRLIDDLHSGEITWSEAWLAAVEAQLVSDLTDQP
jgi:DNA-binding PadR family transcriptional regulator